MSNSLDFQALLSNLRAKQEETNEPMSKPSLPLYNPSSWEGSRDPPTLPNAPNTFQIPDRTVASPSTASNAPANATAQGLLSLLNFGQLGTNKENFTLTRSASENAKTEREQEQQPSAMSASDLVARFMSVTPKGEGNRLPFGTPNDGVASQKIEAPSPSASQDALLRLLNRSSSNGARSAAGGSESKSQVPATAKPRPSVDSREGRDSPIRLFGTVESRESTPFEISKFEEVQEVPSSKPIFTYKNPFEALNASRHETPQPASPVGQSNPPLIKTEFSTADEPLTGEERKSSVDSRQPHSSTRRKLTPKVPIRLGSKEKTEESLKDNELDQSSKLTSTILEPSLDRTEAIQSSPTMEAQESREEKSKDNGRKRKPRGDGQDLRDEKPEPADADGWESVDDSPFTKPTKREVPVYNFPIKPFVSISLQPSARSAVGLREGGIMEISRLKKEFDQIDRSLASATVKYISYALVKNGGLRIIRQDDGVDRQVFRNSHDRIFNVSFCSTAINTLPSNDQAVLGTGVSGAVYYATVSKEGSDLFEQNLLETESLIFPPFPLGDENVAGGALKTRAKRSSRHPEFFGIGRGKTIHIVWPATALSSKYGISETNRKVDVEKLFKDRALRITTGKAGKDFAFSEDDSVIVSLDKLGRMRFWDIRPLVDEENATAAKVSPVNVDTPVLTLSTASPSEKSWPTSVMFVDKPRPYTKGGALRYILIGMRQNHTLQLWDLALGKAVQEINFPHESESDGICSINYHPNSAIIVVGHPTRNSLYFIHLSAPRYTLTPMSQAVFIDGIAQRDPAIPKPDSTACMSGLREISFADKGHLRSVELLPIFKPTDAAKTPSATQGLFELYVVHSKGVTCLSIVKEDLGWSSDSKVIRPVDAVAEGVIALKDFRLGSFVDESAGTRSQSEEGPVPAKALKKKVPVLTRPSDDSQITKEKEPEASGALEALSFTNGSAADLLPIRDTLLPKEGKKQRKKQASNPSVPNPSNSNPRALSPTKATLKDNVPSASALKEPSTMAPTNLAPVNRASATGDPRVQPTPAISGDWLDSQFKKIEKGISAEFRKELERLYYNFHTDRNVQDSAASARQEAMLRIISTSLSSNVEVSMSRIISTQMQQVVVPAVTSVALQAVTAQVGEAIARVLHQLVPHELGTQMPVAINTALQNPQITRAIADAVSQKVASHIETQVVDSLQKSILPAFKNLALTAAEKAAADVEKRMGPKVRQLEADRQVDLAKIDKLSQVMQGMAETMQAMSDSQVAFQGQILRDRRQFSQLSEVTPPAASRQVSTARQSTPLSAPLPKPAANHAKSKEQVEYDDISRLMAEGKYEQGSIRWLQSPQPVELFDNLFVRFTPDYLTTDVSPLVAFSVAITVANSLSTNTVHRIDWINTAFSAVDLNDPEIADLSEHAPALLSSLIQKLEAIDSQAAGGVRDERLLQAVAGLSMRARSMRAELVGHGQDGNRGRGYNHHYGQLDA